MSDLFAGAARPQLSRGDAFSEVSLRGAKGPNNLKGEIAALLLVARNDDGKVRSALPLIR
jgi:hypothetical protein